MQPTNKQTTLGFWFHKQSIFVATVSLSLKRNISLHIGGKNQVLALTKLLKICESKFRRDETVLSSFENVFDYVRNVMKVV